MRPRARRYFQLSPNVQQKENVKKNQMGTFHDQPCRSHGENVFYVRTAVLLFVATAIIEIFILNTSANILYASNRYTPNQDTYIDEVLNESVHCS